MYFGDQGAETQTLTRTSTEQRPVKYIHESQDSEWQCIHESKQYVAFFRINKTSCSLVNEEFD